MARLWRVEVEVLHGRLADRCRSLRLRIALQLEDGLLNLGELGAELLEQHLLALRHCTELLLHKVHACNQATLDCFDGAAHVLERGLELDLQRRRVGVDALKMSIEDAGHFVVGLEHLMLQGLQAICVVVAGRHNPLPGGSVEIVLAAQIPDKLRELVDGHRRACVLLAHGFRHLCAGR